MTFALLSAASATQSLLVTTRQAATSQFVARRPLSLLRMLPSAGSKTSLSSKTPSLSSFSTSSASSSSSSDNNNAIIGSQRGQNAVGLLPSYLADARQVQCYDPVTAPNGALQLGVAESQLVEDLLVPKLNQLAREVPFTADGIYYQPTPGRPGLKTALASYMQELLQLPSLPDTDGMIVGAGCNAVLENLCFALAEPGETCLIPTPYYAAFEFDLVARAGLQIQAVNTMEYSGVDTTDSSKTVPVEAYYPTPAALDAAYDKASSKPRILLLSHPHNPLGICYPAHVVQDCIDWCRDRKIHLISDEIYAGSVHGGKDANFVSALELAASPTSGDDDLGLGPYIHWVYAMSKDFALSGLRVGVAYTENTDIRMPLQKMNDMCQISSHTQMMVEAMMTAEEGSGEKWTTFFRKQHHARLQARGKRLQALLEEFEIPYLPAMSGLFCWMDLSQFLSTDGGSDEERERALYLKMVQEYGLLFTPGSSMRNERPGFFRCVFSAASDDEYELALKRIRTFLATETS